MEVVGNDNYMTVGIDNYNVFKLPRLSAIIIPVMLNDFKCRSLVTKSLTLKIQLNDGRKYCNFCNTFDLH